MIEMHNLKPIKDETMIRGTSALRRRLDASSLPLLQESSRSAHSLKTFPVEKLSNTGRSRMSDDNKEPLLSKRLQAYRFISRMVCYDTHGLMMIEIHVQSLKMMPQGHIKEKKQHTSQLIRIDDSSFEDHLEMIGF